MTVAQRVADTLQAAYAGPPVAPPTSTFPDLTLDEAYAAQLLQIERRLASGRRVVGHKIGLTSAAMQELLGVDQPDYGHLLDDMVVADSLSIDRFLQPRIEPEIGFVLGRDLQGPGVDEVAAAAAVEAAFPALEIVDSRIADWQIGLLDTIADNASSGAVVLGPERVALRDLDLPSVSVTMRRNGQDVGTGTGAAVMGNPLRALAWLANTLGARGIRLEAGHIILAGAMCAMVPVAAGDQVTAEFPGFGAVSVRFTS